MLRHRYWQHKARAKTAGIGFRLSFGDWLRIWQNSGHLSKRGCHNGQYVMARIGDKGAYEIGNVQIVTCNQNHAERKFSKSARAAIGKASKSLVRTAAHRMAISKALKGRIFSEKTRQLMSLAAKRRVARMSKSELKRRMKSILNKRWK